MKLDRDVIGALVMLIFFTAYGVAAWSIPLLPFEAYDAVASGTMPRVYALIGMLAATAALVARFVGAPSDHSEEIAGVQPIQLYRLGALLVAMLLYGFFMVPLGFLLSTVLFLVGGMLVLGERRWGLLLGASVPVVVVFWLLMTRVLGMYLEPGILG